MATLEDILRKERKLKGFTLQEVQDKIKVSNSYLCTIETGRILRPSGIILQRLADLYKMDLVSLLGRSDAKDTQKYGKYDDRWIKQVLKSSAGFTPEQMKELLGFALYQDFKERNRLKKST